MNIYGNAAEWKEHGSYFQFPNGARLWFAYLRTRRTRWPIRASA